MTLLWDHYTQYLVIYEIDLVLLLLLLIFYNTLLSYSLVLIRIITTTGIPARHNKKKALSAGQYFDIKNTTFAFSKEFLTVKNRRKCYKLYYKKTKGFLALVFMMPHFCDK